MTAKMPATKAEREQKKREALAAISNKLQLVKRALVECASIADEAQIEFYFQGMGYGMGGTYYPNLKKDTERLQALEKLTEDERALLGLPVDLEEVFSEEHPEWTESNQGQWVSSNQNC